MSDEPLTIRISGGTQAEREEVGYGLVRSLESNYRVCTPGHAPPNETIDLAICRVIVEGDPATEPTITRADEIIRRLRSINMESSVLLLELAGMCRAAEVLKDALLGHAILRSAPHSLKVTLTPDHPEFDC